MSKNYKIVQCKWSDNGFVQPIFPVTDESIKTMLETGIATPTETTKASWGSGIYTKEGDEWICIDNDWDTSG